MQLIILCNQSIIDSVPSYLLGYECAYISWVEGEGGGGVATWWTQESVPNKSPKINWNLAQQILNENPNLQYAYHLTIIIVQIQLRS